MNNKFLTFFLFAGLSISFINAQGGWYNRANDQYEKDWSIGAGFNIVDDSGHVLGGIIDPGENWNFSNPFTLNAEYFLNNKYSFAAMMSFNKYIDGKNIDDTGYIMKGHEASYFAFDLAGKFSFRDIFHSYTFDPYAFLGFGFTKIGAYKTEPGDLKYNDEVDYDEDGNINVPAIGRMTINAGFGFNYWFNDVWGLNLNAMGKFGLGTSEHERNPNSVSNQKQYSLGVIYLFPEEVLGRISN